MPARPRPLPALAPFTPFGDPTRLLYLRAMCLPQPDRRLLQRTERTAGHRLCLQELLETANPG